MYSPLAGVGKTEISRRLAKITDAPFVKVEATKFTEVGYHGRDVDTIIDDLLKNAVAITKEKIRSKHQKEAREKAEDRVLEALAGKDEMDTFREHLREGGLDDMDVTIELAEKLPGPKMLFSECMQSAPHKCSNTRARTHARTQRERCTRWATRTGERPAWRRRR